MKLLLDVVGVLMALVGIIWIFQGIGLLPGSFMSGQLQWAAYGAVALVAGCVSLYLASRRSTLSKP